MRRIIAALCAALLLIALPGGASAVSKVDIVSILAGARRGMTRDEIKGEIGLPDEETDARLTYDDPINNATLQYEFTDGALSSINVVVAYPADGADLLYLHFLLLEAELMEYLNASPSFQSYAEYADMEAAKRDFDGGMFGWYGVNGGDVYAGATFDTGTPLLYVSCTGLAEK